MSKVAAALTSPKYQHCPQTGLQNRAETLKSIYSFGRQSNDVIFCQHSLHQNPQRQKLDNNHPSQDWMTNKPRSCCISLSRFFQTSILVR